MNINIEKLKGDLRELSTLIEDYESIYYNLYNELTNCSIFWSDNNSLVFFDNVSTEKLAVNETITEFRQIIELYNYLVNRYSEFGTNIKFDIRQKNDILKKFDNYIDVIYDILSSFNNLSFSFDRTVSDIIYRDIDGLNDIINILGILKNRIKKHFNTFEEIEKEISLKISKINIDIFKETEISNLI